VRAEPHQVTWEVVDGKAVWDGRTLADWIPDVVADIVRGFDPLQVIVFGSAARGDDGPDSDLDLLVVLSSVAPSEKASLMAAVRSVVTVHVPIDVFVTDPRELARRKDLVGSLQYWPVREGKVVYESEDAKARLAVSEPPDDARADARERLRRAADDLRAAQTLLSSGPARLACFLAHLAAEKALKAMLASVGEPFPKVHDLGELADRLPPELRAGLPENELRALNPWAIEGRYGEELTEPLPETAEHLVGVAAAILSVVEGWLASEPEPD
jgi:HEPN domain-containing protein/predicted nucleotidyltransferase